MQTLKDVRILRALPQHELAQKVGVNTSTIAHWETGRSRPALRYRRQLAEVLGLSMEDLFRLCQSHVPRQTPARS